MLWLILGALYFIWVKLSDIEYELKQQRMERSREAKEKIYGKDPRA